jgi:hypothetical protein
LSVKWHGSEDRKILVNWSGSPPNVLEVEALPMIQLEGTREHKQRSKKKVKRRGSGDQDGSDVEVDVEVIGIPEERKIDPTELHPFIIRWKMESERRRCFVIGCEDPSTQNKWLRHLRLYSNVGKRHCGAFLWKLNADVVAELSDDCDTTDPETRENLANIQNWRRRLCFLESLTKQKALCITYISEKSDAEERVANTLTSYDQGDVAKIRRIPHFTLAPMTSREVEDVKVSVYQYDVAVSGPEDAANVILPTSLHPFEVLQTDDARQGQKRSIYAFEDAHTCSRWITAIDESRQSFPTAAPVKS